MKVFGYFTEGYASPFPVKATNYPSLTAAIADLEKLHNASQWQEPNPVGHIYLGEADGDEETLGYPDFPDYRLKVGRRGGFVCRRLRH